MSRNAINHMISYHKGKILPTFEEKPILPTMNRKKPLKEATRKLLQENQELRRRLERVHLKIESYEVMGDILQESYGIDLLKKSTAKLLTRLKERHTEVSLQTLCGLFGYNPASLLQTYQKQL